MLDLPSEQALLGHGVSTCATCDGFFFRGKEIAVIGGGDSAVEEATFLTKFADKVTLIHRRKELRASKIMQDRAFANPKIDFRWNTVVEHVIGDGRVEGVELRDIETGKHRRAADQRFVRRDRPRPEHEVVRRPARARRRTGTSSPVRRARTRHVAGVFASGDVQDHVYRQAITAAGSGCAAAIDAERYLEALGHPDPHLVEPERTNQ